MTPRPALTRRTALTVAAVAPAALTGCDIDPSADPTPSGAATATPLEDSVLVGSLVTAIAEAESVVTAASDAVPALRPALEPLLATHAAHRSLLLEADPDTPATDAPTIGSPGNRRAALTAVRRAENRLRSQVQRGCVGSSSGDLARVLAAMTSSLAQHSAALDAALAAEARSR